MHALFCYSYGKPVHCNKRAGPPVRIVTVQHETTPQQTDDRISPFFIMFSVGLLEYSSIKAWSLDYSCNLVIQ